MAALCIELLVAQRDSATCVAVVLETRACRGGRQFTLRHCAIHDGAAYGMYYLPIGLVFLEPQAGLTCRYIGRIDRPSKIR